MAVVTKLSSGSGGGSAQTIANGHGFPGSGPSSGSGGSNGGKVAAASGGRGTVQYKSRYRMNVTHAIIANETCAEIDTSQL